MVTVTIFKKIYFWMAITKELCLKIFTNKTLLLFLKAHLLVLYIGEK